jgi:hypothetical protein
VLEPRAREVMRELSVAVGRPMIHDLRAMCEAVSYVVKNGSSGAQPSAFIVDSQIVRAHDTVSKKTSGYRRGKKVTGRGQHLDPASTGSQTSLSSSATASRSTTCTGAAHRIARLAW